MVRTVGGSPLAPSPPTRELTALLYQADMAFFETPAGGAVLSVSCISWGLGLNGNDRDNQVSRVVKNLVDRFVSEEPFAYPPAN